MYSKAQIKDIRLRMDKYWTTQEKIQQYGCLVKIFARERRKELNEADQIRRRQEKMIRELHKDCMYFRSYLGSVMFGSKQKLRNALQNRRLQMRFQDQKPEKATEYFAHSNNRKQRIIDRLKYRGKKQMAVFRKLRMERATLQDKLGLNDDNVKFRQSFQILRNRLQTFVVRQTAAAEVGKLYKKLLDLLHSDSNYFDAMLEALQEDRKEQCKCVLRATELGQIAQDELTDIHNQYEWLEQEVRANMRMRDKEVKSIKRKAEETGAKLTFMSRMESFASSEYLSTAHRLEASADALQARQEEQARLEEVLSCVREAVSVPAVHEVFPRVVRQLEQEELLLRLAARVAHARAEAERAKRRHQCLLEALAHGVARDTAAFQQERARLEREAGDEKYRLRRERQAQQEVGEMLQAVKLQLACVAETVGRLKERGALASASSSEGSADGEPQPLGARAAEALLPPPLESDPARLLHGVRLRLDDLLDRAEGAQKELGDEDALRDMAVARLQHALRRRWHEHGPAKTGSLVDAVEDDVAVPSRADVKQSSKVLVEKQLRLQEFNRSHSSLRRRT